MKKEIDGLLENETVQNMIKTISEKAAAEAIKKYTDEMNMRRLPHNKRVLRNTEILLKNYHSFKDHIENAIFTKEQLEDNDVSELIDDLYNKLESDDLDESTYIQSILRTKQRTQIILEHIQNAINFYESQSVNWPEEKQRKLKVLKEIYINGKRPDEVAADLNYSVKTIFRDKKEAIRDLSTLLFGIDGVRLLR